VKDKVGSYVKVKLLDKLQYDFKEGSSRETQPGEFELLLACGWLGDKIKKIEDQEESKEQ
jgi:hypothetical protein